MKTEARRSVEKLHAEVSRWWADAAKLEQQSKKIPASKMRQRMQEIGWHLKHIESLMDREAADLTARVEKLERDRAWQEHLNLPW